MDNRNFRILIIALMLLLGSMCSSQTILLEPFGFTDQPLPRIEIRVAQVDNNSKDEVIFEKHKKKTIFIYSVNASTFNLLKKIVEENNTKITYDLNSKYEYGTYKVSFNHNDTKFEYMLISDNKSYLFFKQMLPLIKNYNRLYEQITLLLTRLD